MKKVFNVPNMLSVFRILLIPLFIALYLGKSPEDFGVAAGIVLLLSGVTDMLDGYIARRFEQVTSVGQVLDPIADKLTQAAVVICIAFTHQQNLLLILLVLIFVLKEIFMGAGSLLLYKRGERPAAALWFGKLGTVVFYVVMLIIVFVPQMPELVTTILVAIVAAFMIFAFIRYAILFWQMLKGQKSAIVLSEKNKDNPEVSGD